MLPSDDEVEPYCNLHDGFLFIAQFLFPLGGGGGGGGGAHFFATTSSLPCLHSDVVEVINGVRQQRFRLEVFNQHGKLLSSLASKNKYYCSEDLPFFL